MNGQSTEKLLCELQKESFEYFRDEYNPDNGLVADSTETGAPCSIAALGFALASYCVAAERGFLTRRQALGRALEALRFFETGSQGTASDAIGYNGFFYHFLDMKKGRRFRSSEVSTIDSTLLAAGALVAAAYFDRATGSEAELRELAEKLYAGMDWRWACNGRDTVCHGWRPRTGFIRYYWQGYNEALLLYLLALGSPSHPIKPLSYAAWASTYSWKRIYGFEFLYAGPLFVHQYPHVWVDFRGIRDVYVAARHTDYFENSRRATFVHREYAIRNPKAYTGYAADCWGITASKGPGPMTLMIDGIERRFYDYRARGVPFGPDDGTLSPWAVLASIPFAPEIVLPAMTHICSTYSDLRGRYGLYCSFNPTYPDRGRSCGWNACYYYGVDQGPAVTMIENHRSGLIWELMRRSPHLRRGLRAAGFKGGWIQNS